VENNQLLKAQAILEKYSTGYDKIRSEVAEQVLERMELDNKSKIVAFLYPSFLHGDLHSDDVLKDFGEEVLNILESLKKLHKLSFESEQEEAENIRKIFFAVSKDLRVVLIKLAFAYARLSHLNPDKDDPIKESNTVLILYAPLASRLGLQWLKTEMEAMAFAILEPEIYKTIKSELDKKFKEKANIVNELIEKVKGFTEELNIEATVYGRKKSVYSIYKKTVKKNKTFDTIYDLIAVRAIVNTVSECYSLLGRIHGELTCLQNQFDDYIAIPKSNGYQSLHTTVMFHGVPVEIQIRTKEMHRVSEYGVAAHWMYKEGRNKVNNLDSKLAWFRQMIEEQNNMSASELIENISIDVEDSEIFVQSPKGKVVHLQKGAIPIDFAYSIHSEIGNKCVGAKVNGKIVPLTTPLTNGDIVEIITSQTSKGPSRDWLNIVKCASTKTKIRNFFKHELKDENIKIGKSMFEQIIKNKGYVIDKLIDPDLLKTVLDKFNFNTIDELYAAIGYNAVSASTVVMSLVNQYKKSIREKVSNQNVIERKSYYLPVEKDIKVKGLINTTVKFAKCCQPMYGDDIIGFVSSGKGVIIHRHNCFNLNFIDNERFIEVSWKPRKENK